MDEHTCDHPLAFARAARGMTRVDLVRLMHEEARRRGLRTGVDKQRIRKWEVNNVIPDRDSQTYIAAALGIPASVIDAGTWPDWLHGTSSGVIPLGPYSTVPALREALGTAMERRIFLSVSGAALTALAASWATGDTRALREAPSGQPVGDELVAMLEESSAGLNALPTEQRQHIPALLHAHLATVTNLLENGRYPQRVGLRLHALAAALAQTVAWHRFDTADHPAAARFWVAGLHSAHAGGDRDMGAALLGDLAYQAAWRREHVTAVGILEHAISRTDHPAARSLLNLRLARTHAAQGERRAALQCLNAAEWLLDAASGGERPAWCAWLSEADLAVDSGQTLLDLGDTARAHRLIGEGQALLPAARAKTYGVFLAYQAESHLNLREPELAAVAARESLQLARRIGAPRCVQLVQDLVPAFRTYRDAEGVPELLQLAAS